MQSKAATVAQYLAELSEDRRKTIETVRRVILDNLDSGFEEGMQYGMIGYYVPHRLYPAGYHCDPKQPLPFAALASQKNHMAIYLMWIYGDTEQAREFQKDWEKSGRKLDMGKCCVRFRKLEDVALEAIAQAISRMTAAGYIEVYKTRLDKAKSRSSAASAKNPPGSGKKASASSPKKSVVKSKARRVAGTKAAKKKS